MNHKLLILLFLVISLNSYSQTNSEKNLIVKYYTAGFCYNNCSHEFTIYDNGYSQWEKGSLKVVALLTKEETSKLLEIIDKTDFNEIMSHKFNGHCPSNSDGPAHEITFYLKKEKIFLPDCKYNLSRNYKVFQFIGEMKDKYFKDFYYEFAK